MQNCLWYTVILLSNFRKSLNFNSSADKIVWLNLHSIDKLLADVASPSVNVVLSIAGVQHSQPSCYRCSGQLALGLSLTIVSLDAHSWNWRVTVHMPVNQNLEEQHQEHEENQVLKQKR